MPDTQVVAGAAHAADRSGRFVKAPRERQAAERRAVDVVEEQHAAKLIVAGDPVAAGDEDGTLAEVEPSRGDLVDSLRH